MLFFNLHMYIVNKSTLTEVACESEKLLGTSIPDNNMPINQEAEDVIQENDKDESASGSDIEVFSHKNMSLD